MMLGLHNVSPPRIVVLATQLTLGAGAETACGAGIGDRIGANAILETMLLSGPDVQRSVMLVLWMKVLRKCFAKVVVGVFTEIS